MRIAELRRYQRKIVEQRKEWPLQLNRFVFSNVPSLGQGEFGLDSPLTIICGPNGAGKTTLLRAIWATASPQSYVATPGTSLKLGSGEGQLDFAWNGTKSHVAHAFGADAPDDAAFPVPVVHVDTADRPTQLQTEFCSLGDFDEITNGLAPNILTERELSEVKALCARDYRSASIYEVEIGDKFVPFFEVAYGDDRYDSRTMGTGEAAALYLWWSLSSMDENSLVLIEEPETYLSPASQEAFIQYLSAQILKKKLCAVVTSHSSKLIEAVPDIHHTFIHRYGGKIRLDTGGASPELLEMIGVKTPIEAVLLVEDEAAKVFAQRILSRLKPELARRCEIAVMGGHGDISAVLRKTQGRITQIRFVGLYDGDQRGAVDGDVVDKAAFLPGDIPVEQVFQQMLTANPDEAATALGAERLTEILNSLEGWDHHDWYTGLAKKLAYDENQLFLLLYRIWERDEEAMKSALACVAEIETILDPTAADLEKAQDGQTRNDDGASTMLDETEERLTLSKPIGAKRGAASPPRGEQSDA